MATILENTHQVNERLKDVVSIENGKISILDEKKLRRPLYQQQVSNGSTQ